MWRPGRPRVPSLDNIAGEWTPKEARRLTIEELYNELEYAKGRWREIIQAEIKHKEAWRSPTGRSFWISLTALGVSVVALAVAVFK